MLFLMSVGIHCGETCHYVACLIISDCELRSAGAQKMDLNFSGDLHVPSHIFVFYRPISFPTGLSLILQSVQKEMGQYNTVCLLLVLILVHILK